MNQKKPLFKSKIYRLPFHPSAILLAAQLLQLVLFAALENLAGYRAVIGSFSVIVLVLVVWVINHSPGITWLNWALAVPSFILSLLSAIFVNNTLLMIASLFEGILYLFAAGSLIAYMLSDENVTTDELFAVGATFTLLAWAFAFFYQAIQILLPGSFVSSLVLDRPLNFIEYLSLSFTNLSATGLGDIVPATSWARILVMMEQFAGIGYVATVVSRLIGLTLQKQSSKRK